MRKQFKKDIRSLEAVFGFLREFADDEGIDGQSSYILDLAVEEFFTNIVKYGRGTGNEILLDAVRNGNILTIRLEEETSVPFDVTRPTETQFDIPFEDRKPGGLGIHIAREMLDGLSYDFVDGTSRITLTKILEK